MATRLAAAALLILLPSVIFAAGSASLTRVLLDVPDAFVPGFLIEQRYLPPNCAYKAVTGDLIKKHYNGTLKDGTLFDSSYSRGTTYDFSVGLGYVIRGMDMGVSGVCKGEKRRITIPPELGYGNQAIGSIPPNSVLTFEIEIIDIVPSGYKSELLYKPPVCTRRSTTGDLIREHYNGTLTNGNIFDTSYSRGRTFDFTLSESNVIKGVDMAMMNMCPGERRRLRIPPILAYGNQGLGTMIPPDATLLFDVELVEIVKGTLKFYRIGGAPCTAGGDRVGSGDIVTIIYNGFSEVGGKYSAGPLKTYIGFATVTVHGNGVLRGLSKGIVGMCPREMRRMKIPPELAVGDIRNANIPQGVRLSLDVKVINIEKKDLFKFIDANNDNSLTMDEVERFLKASQEFAERSKDTAKLNRLKDFHHTQRDANKDGLVSRAEFYSKFYTNV